MEFIELKDVYKVYKNGVTGLAGVNLQIKKGDNPCISFLIQKLPPKVW